MSGRSPDRPRAASRDEGTRDIRLPPLPGRAAPTVPPEWVSYVPAAAPESAGPEVPGPPPGIDEPTDRLASPADPARQHTLAFTPPPLELLKVSVSPRRRRTSRVLWTLFCLILALIVAAGVALVVLVGQR